MMLHRYRNNLHLKRNDEFAVLIIQSWTDIHSHTYLIQVFIFTPKYLPTTNYYISFHCYTNCEETDSWHTVSPCWGVRVSFKCILVYSIKACIIIIEWNMKEAKHNNLKIVKERNRKHTKNTELIYIELNYITKYLYTALLLYWYIEWCTIDIQTLQDAITKTANKFNTANTQFRKTIQIHNGFIRIVLFNSITMAQFAVSSLVVDFTTVFLFT